MRSVGEIAQNCTSLEFWKRAFSRYCNTLENSKFGSIVFDYDGTLCDPRLRFSGLDVKLGSILDDLVEKGITLGIATGRGKSVRKDMQKVIHRSNWGKVWIGYYNGSDIALLDDEKRPEKNAEINPVLKEFAKALTGCEISLKIKTIEERPNQISIEPISSVSTAVWSILEDVVHKGRFEKIQILESSHSFDVLAPGVSKLALVNTIIQGRSTNANSEVLCIGDKGKWPGNDYELLGWKYSLSADTVSSDPNSCWNFAPLGHRGVQATSYYLEAFDVENGLMSIGKHIFGGRPK